MLAGEEANEGGGEAYGAGMGVDVVATYLRTGRRKKINKIKAHLSPKEKTSWSRHLIQGKRQKNQKRSANFEKKGFRSCLRIGKVLAPLAPVTRDGSL